jgi:hypothetical protein
MRRSGGLLVMVLVTALSACATPPAPPDERAPPFARVPYQPFSRDAVVAIALREWRLFGAPIDDNPPGSYRPATADDKPERQQGLWQRIGEYWWLAMSPSAPEGAWTGKHDANGAVFPASQDGDYAWSAAFVSYVMRIAGAGQHFPYSASHSDYIDLAKQQALGRTSGWAITAEPAISYAPEAGDLICRSRDFEAPPNYDDLPIGHFASHCDVVVRVDGGLLTVIGGNVDDAVTMKHVPTTPEGMLVRRDGTIVDTRYGWFVVIRVLYPGRAQNAQPAV